MGIDPQTKTQPFRVLATGIDKLTISLALEKIRPETKPEVRSLGLDGNENTETKEGVEGGVLLGTKEGVEGGVGLPAKVRVSESGASLEAHRDVAFRRQFVGFTGGAGYKHKWLVKAPELEHIVRDFIGS